MSTTRVLSNDEWLNAVAGLFRGALSAEIITYTKTLPGFSQLTDDLTRRNAWADWATRSIESLYQEILHVACDTDGFGANLRYLLGGHFVPGTPNPGNMDDIRKNLLLHAPPPPVARQGIVQASSGRGFGDAGGEFLPLGATFFWAPWGMANDRPRTRRNFLTLQKGKFHYARYLCAVGGPSWADRTIDPLAPGYVENLRDTLDMGYDEYGIRGELTVLGGGTDEEAAIRAVEALVAGREHKIFDIEVCNEYQISDRAKIKPFARRLRAVFPGLITLTSELDLDILDALMDGSGANLIGPHTDRFNGTADGGWRQVRQAWDFRDKRWPGMHHEPPGVRSSVATNEDPLQLAMMRAMGVLCGLSAYTLHTGAGIRGGGIEDIIRFGRAANFDEQPGWDAIVSALNHVADLLPSDLGAWTHFNGSWTGHPLPADLVWSDNPANDHGLIRTYANIRGSQFVALPHGIKEYYVATSLYNAHVKYFNPTTKALMFERDCHAGEQFPVNGPERGGLAAYVVHGQIG